MASIALPLYCHYNKDGGLDIMSTFVCISLWNLIAHNIRFFPMGSARFVEAKVAAKRFQVLLENLENKQENFESGLIEPETVADNDSELEIDPETMISCKNAFFEANDGTEILKNIDFEAKKGEFIGICGKSGSGKSSLLKSFIGCLEKTSGELFLKNTTKNSKTSAPVAYYNQDTWIMHGTVQQNINIADSSKALFYPDTVKACQLLPDLKQLANGDQTLLGINGAAISGGQKARICLARALQSNTEIVLLDDPLAAVDRYVAKELFGNVILKMKEAGKTVILVTHQVDYLLECDAIFVMEDGEIIESGSPEFLLAERVENESQSWGNDQFNTENNEIPELLITETSEQPSLEVFDLNESSFKTPGTTLTRTGANLEIPFLDFKNVKWPQETKSTPSGNFKKMIENSQNSTFSGFGKTPICFAPRKSEVPSPRKIVTKPRKSEILSLQNKNNLEQMPSEVFSESSRLSHNRSMNSCEKLKTSEKSSFSKNRGPEQRSTEKRSSEKYNSQNNSIINTPIYSERFDSNTWHGDLVRFQELNTGESSKLPEELVFDEPSTLHENSFFNNSKTKKQAYSTDALKFFLKQWGGLLVIIPISVLYLFACVASVLTFGWVAIYILTREQGTSPLPELTEVINANSAGLNSEQVFAVVMSALLVIVILLHVGRSLLYSYSAF